MTTPDPAAHASMLEELPAGLNKPAARIPVALDYDPAYAAGRTLFEHLVRDVTAREVLRKALADSGGAGTDSDRVNLILSPCATVEDRDFFLANPTRTHLIREAIDGEPVLTGRTPACDFIVVVRQLQRGVRLSVAIPQEHLIVTPGVRSSWVNHDEVLSAVVELAISGDLYRHPLDRIIAYVDSQRSAASTSDLDSRRRLS